MASGRKQRYILYLTLLQVVLGFGIIIPILPHFALELGASSWQMGLVLSVWALAQFLFSPMWGAFSDRVGRRPILLVGLAGYAVNFGLIAIAPNIWVVMLSRFIGGILASATVPTAQAYIADTSSLRERSASMAGMGVAMNLGFIGGPALGGMLTGFGLGYRQLFLAAGCVALLNWVLAFFALPEPEKRQAATRRKGFSGLKAVRIALGGPEALLFLLAFGGTFGGSTLFAMLGYFLEQRLDLGPEFLGVAFTLEGGAAVLFQWLLVGQLTRRFGEERPLGWALLGGSLGYLILCLAGAPYQVLIAVVFVALGIAFIRPLIASLISKRTRMEQGVSMGIMTSFDALGRTVGPTVAGVAYLWRDWAPFGLAIAMYLLFYVLLSISLSRTEPASG